MYFYKIRLHWFFLILFLIPDITSAQVKSFEEVIGYSFGDRITQSHQILDYLSYLEEASDRVILLENGTTFDHRKQVAAIITSPDNHARLGEIKENAQSLNDARVTSHAEADEIIQNQPAILYLVGPIHGFGLSGTEGVLKWTG